MTEKRTSGKNKQKENKMERNMWVEMLKILRWQFVEGEEEN